ncbi:MAG: N-6 DNA methylase [Bernardetiaceae bacterium]|nr:N-6 DNA methylase [Bernardetiaceae bacterium]
MQQYIDKYLSAVQKQYQIGIASEHRHRGYLAQLLSELTQGIEITNEPARIACGSPDYVLTQKAIPLGYIEAKDIGDKDLEGKRKNREQFERYKEALDNIIFTDYLRFIYYREGQKITEITIAKIENEKIISLEDNFEAFTQLIATFTNRQHQHIKDPLQLAEMMAKKARMIQDVIYKTLTSETESSLHGQFFAFQDLLIKGMNKATFADVYAQTIAYGLFAARFHDRQLDTFSRQKAAELLPQSNPFLRKLFQYIAGYDVDKRMLWIIDDLIEIFRATDLSQILNGFGKHTGAEDPIIHFYETFLSRYNPALRKSRGVWYTPEPVVKFIVRAVDEVLKTEFDLTNGLAHEGKIYHENKPYHKVQILDPATGTGTFLAETVKYIYQTYFKNIKGVWADYAEKELIPRLNGFELMMASYAMAHLKMDMLLFQTGYKNPNNQRFNIFLTNSLEEAHSSLENQFTQWLTREAQEADRIKKDAPVMVVMGNPPYSVSSQNKNAWIIHLIEDYKKELNERNIQPLSDDYIKFIRYAQHLVQKNGEGIVAMITNNSFIDGTIHRQMRKYIIDNFDAVYILNLHGSAKKEVVLPIDVTKDENVFDIMQGVSINIFVKKPLQKQKKYAEVFYKELLGSRNFKLEFLDKHNLESVVWQKVDYKKPYYFFFPKDFAGEAMYKKGFALEELFNVYSGGLVTARDHLTIANSVQEAKDTIDDLVYLSEKEARSKYKLGADSRDWDIKSAQKDIIKTGRQISHITKIDYRVFDSKFIYYTKISKGFISYPRYETMKHLKDTKNYALITTKLLSSSAYRHVFISQNLVDKCTISNRGKETNYVFPLYLYPNINTLEEQTQLLENMKLRYEEAEVLLEGFEKVKAMYEKAKKPDELLAKYYNEQMQAYQKAQKEADAYKKEWKEKQNQSLFAKDIDKNLRLPNFKSKTIKRIAEHLGMSFEAEKTDDDNSKFAPIDILDYVYAILHAPTYRKTYNEFLKIDFPRIPLPQKENFWQLVKFGAELRALHGLTHECLEEPSILYPIDGDNLVETIGRKSFKMTDSYKKIGQVWINSTQYFTQVPQKAWEFYIGAYQPAQKWLKDRKGRNLSPQEIVHYQKMITALVQTDKVMQAIDSSCSLS